MAMTHTPLFEETVRSTGFLPDHESIPPDELEEVHLIARSGVVVGAMRAFGYTATARMIGHRPPPLPALRDTGPLVRVNNDTGSWSVPARRMDKEN